MSYEVRMVPTDRFSDLRLLEGGEDSGIIDSWRTDAPGTYVQVALGFHQLTRANCDIDEVAVVFADIPPAAGC
jgi:hypothetical protein